MSRSDFLVDEELIRRLPLPLAQLYRHACNARSSLDRHQAACFLWEVALKLWGSAAIVEYAERGLHDPAVVEELKHLARPSLGHWRSFVRLLVPVVTPGDEGFAKRNELLAGKSRDDLPWLAGLDAALREKLEGKSGARSTVKLAELLDRIVAYRNKVAHGGLHNEQKDDRFSVAFLAGATELFGRIDPLAGRRMVYVDEMRRQSSGNWLVTLYDLMGETPKRQVPFDVPDSDRTARLKPGLQPGGPRARHRQAEGGVRAVRVAPRRVPDVDGTVRAEAAIGRRGAFAGAAAQGPGGRVGEYGGDRVRRPIRHPTDGEVPLYPLPRGSGGVV